MDTTGPALTPRRAPARDTPPLTLFSRDAFTPAMTFQVLDDDGWLTTDHRLVP